MDAGDIVPGRRAFVLPCNSLGFVRSKFRDYLCGHDAIFTISACVLNLESERGIRIKARDAPTIPPRTSEARAVGASFS